MTYDWTGVRRRRLKVARYGAAVALAAFLFGIAIQFANKTL